MLGIQWFELSDLCTVPRVEALAHGAIAMLGEIPRRTRRNLLVTVRTRPPRLPRHPTGCVQPQSSVLLEPVGEFQQVLAIAPQLAVQQNGGPCRGQAVQDHH